MKFLSSLLIATFLGACQASTEPDSSKTEKLPYFINADFKPLWFEAKKIDFDTLHKIADFSFINQDNQEITEKIIANKIHVADFFYTSCPGICPKLTKNLGIVQAAFKNDPNVLLLSYSVMADKDNVAVLKKYAQEKGVLSGKWHLLTGNQKKIYTLARKSYFADEALGQAKGSDDFLHTENVLLIDKHQHIRGIYNGTLAFDMEQLVKDIRTLEKEE